MIYHMTLNNNNLTFVLGGGWSVGMSSCDVEGDEREGEEGGGEEEGGGGEGEERCDHHDDGVNQLHIRDTRPSFYIT